AADHQSERSPQGGTNRIRETLLHLSARPSPVPLSRTPVLDSALSSPAGSFRSQAEAPIMVSGKHCTGTGMPNRSKTIIKGPSAHAAPKRQVIAKAERRLAEADKQRARIKADPVREVVRERLRVKRANKERSEA